MASRILQITYTFDGTREEFEHDLDPVAAAIAAVPGLRWKIWLFDEATSRGGGTYLFDDEAAVQAFLAGPIVAVLRTRPEFRDVSVQSYSIVERPTAVTRGPVEHAVGA